MKHLCRVTVCALFLSLAFVSSAAPDGPSPEEAIADMGWLAGTWSGDMWGGRFVAHYSTPDGGRILSFSQLTRNGSEAFYEFEVFAPDGDAVRLQPFPGGKRADVLTLTSVSAAERRAVFENPDKDYPTHIVYECPTEDELVITLSDPHGGSDRTERFALSADD